MYSACYGNYTMLMLVDQFGSLGSEQPRYGSDGADAQSDLCLCCFCRVFLILFN